MNIAQSVKDTVLNMPAGQVFGYQELPSYGQSPMPVIKAMSRLVADKTIEKLSKGKFYIPKKGLLGVRKPADSELIRSTLYKNGRLRGYVTGLSLYNRLGLTTQIPKTITIAINGSRQEIQFGTINVKTVASRIPIEEKNVKLLQYLDALKDIKNIPDTDINLSLKIIKRLITELPDNEQAQLIALAENYYAPQVRALVGLLYSTASLGLPSSLYNSLNPTTVYKLQLDQTQWLMAKDWNIR